MLNVEEAVEAAKRQLAQVFPEFVKNDLRLEELESPLIAGRWAITFSSAVPTEGTTAATLLEALRQRRIQKMIELDAEIGLLVTLKNKAA